MLDDQTIESLKWDDNGLIPAIIQDAYNGKVLMLAYMNRESLAQTLRTGQTVFWSRSRQELWHKGATSGNIQTIVEIFVDCDADAILIKVNPAGPACHTGELTCFFRSLSSILTSEGTTDV
jgi:phosphoribosyl-ATP pyrophosphohydrolase/phosphoribosyl-AMP cyclohydrolase